MAKIDRLVWASGLVCESFGVRLGLRATTADGLARLAARLPPGWRRARGPSVERLYSYVDGAGVEGARRGVRRFHLLYADAARALRTREAAEVEEAFEADAQLFVAASARGRLFVHAGVVGWRGRAILLPGRSFAGKTTLVAELVRAGAVYYSDEYAVLDAEGRVHPYARPLGVRREGGAARRRVTAEELEGACGVGPLPVGLVYVGEYRPGARWRPRRLTAGQGVLALLSHTVAARREPAHALAVLQRVAGGAAVIKGARGEAVAAAGALLDEGESCWSTTSNGTGPSV
jgi:hypothetical protein